MDARRQRLVIAIVAGVVLCAIGAAAVIVGLSTAFLFWNRERREDSPERVAETREASERREPREPGRFSIFRQKEDELATSREYLERAKLHQQEKRWDDALRDFDKALALDPSEATVYAYRGQIYREKGDLARALAEFDAAVAMNPNMTPAYLERAIVLFGQGRTREAEADIRYARMQHRGDAYVPQYEEQIAEARRRGTIEEPRRAWALTADRAVNEAVRLIHERRDRAAIPYLEHALGRDGDSAAALYYRGNAHLNLQHPHLALEDYDALVRLRPRWAEGYRVRARCYKALFDAGAALADLDRALASDPEFAFAYVDRADLNKWYNPHLAGSILRDYDAAVRIEPDNVLTRNARAVHLIELDRYEDGYADLNRAIELDPKFAPAWCNRAMGLYMQGRKDDAERDFDRCFSLDPQLRVVFGKQKEIADQLPAFRAWAAELADLRAAGASQSRCSQYGGDRRRACEQGSWAELRYLETGEVD